MRIQNIFRKNVALAPALMTLPYFGNLPGQLGICSHIMKQYEIFRNSGDFMDLNISAFNSAKWD
jgi:hypothetical protein